MNTEKKSAKNVSSIDAMKNGFIVLPFKLPEESSLKGIAERSFHYIFARKHQTKLDEEKNCLFLVNLPLLANLDSLKKAFNNILERDNSVAHIEQLLHNDEFGLREVDLSPLTSDLMSSEDSNKERFTPRNTALLKFVDEASLNNCWSSIKKYSTNSHKKSNYITWEYSSPSISTFTNFYKPLSIDYLKEDIHSYMSVFEERERQAQEDIQTSIVDEDGFTLVVGKNTKSLNSIKKKILNRNPLSKHENKVKPPSAVDKKAKQDFYRFQVRERKKQEINELLSKFKEDQAKIKVMKDKKKFNPYAQ
ncbi:Ribosomal RNA-processing protein 7 (RRP7) C-terminal domain [Nakaseomyces glabratus]|nr:Ribosomal RNA-processing protein 7 (RRP7) C-terminal domain [Nakaseomyces glabratus]